MKYFLLALFILPAIVYGQEFKNIRDVLNWLLGLVNDYIVPLLIALAVLAFWWRNIIALFKKDELAQKAEMKWYLFWGVIAIFVMVSIWGLVGILADAFGVKNAVPQLNTGTGNGNYQPCSIARPGAPCIGSNGRVENLPSCRIAREGEPCDDNLFDPSF